MAHTITLKVVGSNKMNCGGCERSVSAALRELAGVEQVRADHTTQQIDVTLGAAESDVAALQAELREIGYEAVPA